MGILRSILTLPVSGPVKGTLWVAGKVKEAADQEYNDPATLRKMLISIEKQLLAGTLSEEDYDIAETDILKRLQQLS